MRAKPIHSSQTVLHKDYDRKGSVAKKEKSQVVILNELGVKTNRK
jgi:hypothetical protein